MQDIKVEWCENATTKTNRPYKKLSVTDSEGNKHNVNIFSDFPDFANIAPGSMIRGKLEANGKYMNLISETQAPKGNPNYKTAQIEKAMDTKRQDITKFQDNKELSVKISGTMRDAVQLSLAEFGADGTQSLEELILKWRVWLWENYDMDVTKTDPFK